MNVDPCPIEHAETMCRHLAIESLCQACVRAKVAAVEEPETPEDRARELAALRAMNEETVRKLRLGAACDALDRCGLSAVAYLLRREGAAVLEPARDAVRDLRVSLRSGSDVPRYAATGAALLALGALWCCS